jgi:hypothetical protein
MVLELCCTPAETCCTSFAARFDAFRLEDGRIRIEKINTPFLKEGGSPAEYGAGLELAIVCATGR